MALAGPALRLIGQGAIADKLQHAIDELTIKLDEIFTRLAAVERKCDAVYRGWEMMAKARQQQHGSETLQERARRIARHVEPDDRPDEKV